MKAAAEFDRIPAIRCLADDFEIRLTVEHEAETGSG
jgi:hypothetical protein